MFEKVMSAFGGSILGGIKELIEQFHMSPADKARLLEAAAAREHELQAKVMALSAGQLEVNKIEAASANWFVAGWRPSVGWICSAGLLYSVIGYPLLVWVSVNAGWNPPPLLNGDTLMTLLFGMLGLGAYRTYEKKESVARN